MKDKLKKYKSVKEGLNEGLAIFYNKTKFESRKSETHQFADGHLKVLILDLMEKSTKKVIRIAQCYFKDPAIQNIPFDQLLQRMGDNLPIAQNQPQEQEAEVVPELQEPEDTQEPVLNEQPVEIAVNPEPMQLTQAKRLKSHERAKLPKGSRRLPAKYQVKEKPVEGVVEAIAPVNAERPVVNLVEAAPEYAIQSQVIVFDYKSCANQDFNAKVFTPKNKL